MDMQNMTTWTCGLWKYGNVEDDNMEMGLCKYGNGEYGSMEMWNMENII